jgi:hypothetical protein
MTRWSRRWGRRTAAPQHPLPPAHQQTPGLPPWLQAAPRRHPSRIGHPTHAAVASSSTQAAPRAQNEALRPREGMSRHNRAPHDVLPGTVLTAPAPCRRPLPPVLLPAINRTITATISAALSERGRSRRPARSARHITGAGASTSRVPLLISRAQGTTLPPPLQPGATGSPAWMTCRPRRSRAGAPQRPPAPIVPPATRGPSTGQSGTPSRTPCPQHAPPAQMQRRSSYPHPPSAGTPTIVVAGQPKSHGLPQH